MISFARGITIVEMRLLSTPSLWDAMALASSAHGNSRNRDQKLGFNDRRGMHGKQKRFNQKTNRQRRQAQMRAWLAARRK